MPLGLGRPLHSKLPLPQPFFTAGLHPESSSREMNSRFPRDAEEQRVTALPERSHPGQGHFSMSSVAPGQPVLHTFSLPGAVSAWFRPPHPKAVSHASPGPAPVVTPPRLLPHWGLMRSCPPFCFVPAPSAGTRPLCFRMHSTGRSPTPCSRALFPTDACRITFGFTHTPLMAQDPCRVVLAKVPDSQLVCWLPVATPHQHTPQTCRRPPVAASPHHFLRSPTPGPRFSEPSRKAVVKYASVRHRHREQACGYQGRRVAGMNRETEIGLYTLIPCIKWITAGNLPHSRRNSSALR